MNDSTSIHGQADDRRETAAEILLGLLGSVLDPDQWEGILDQAESLRDLRDLADDLKTLQMTLDRDIADENERRDHDDVQTEGATDGPRRKPPQSGTRRRLLRQREVVIARRRDVKILIRDHTSDDRDHLASQYRQMLRHLTLALLAHQAANGGNPRPADLDLWQTLDDLTVPMGAEATPVTLRAMGEEHWSDPPAGDVAEQAATQQRRPHSATTPVFRPPTT